ncbi:hypothetical protein FIBSPDRAFT_1050145 [Athelia psychrophila]|uniref:Uncharacterized protein n=1 Tax=Athelia psychrophila TaxID=1759441 RepID=A0A166B6L5_9AGAM|nr:hypothetical protein FIBSPDRAFT_1050145 [Fibularhizoctonia sp. CBS 109695]
MRNISTLIGRHAHHARILVPACCIVLLEDLDAAFTWIITRKSDSIGTPGGDKDEDRAEDGMDPMACLSRSRWSHNVNTLSLSGPLNALDSVAFFFQRMGSHLALDSRVAAGGVSLVSPRLRWAPPRFRDRLRRFLLNFPPRLCLSTATTPVPGGHTAKQQYNPLLMHRPVRSQSNGDHGGQRHADDWDAAAGFTRRSKHCRWRWKGR